MGMSGYYIAVDDALLQDVIDGAQSVLGIDPLGEKTLDIDKSWQGIHQLLCGEPFEGDPPMGYVVPLQYDNRIESESDFGAFYITPSEVKEAADFLRTMRCETCMVLTLCGETGPIRSLPKTMQRNFTHICIPICWS